MKIKPQKYKIRTKQIEYNEFIFFLAYGLYLFALIWNSSFFSIQYGENLYKWVLFFSLLLLVINECNNLKAILRGFVIAFFIVLMSGITYFTHDNEIILNHLFWLLILCFSARNIDFKKIAEFTLKAEEILLLLVILSSVLGIINNYVEKSDRIRFYLGFKYSLFPATLLFNVSALLIWLQRENMKWRTVIFLSLINSLMFYFTQSRLAFGLFILMMICVIGFKIRASIIKKKPCRKKRKRVHFAKILIFSYVLCLFISLGITLSYSDSSALQKKVNIALGDRLELGQNSLKENGVKPFGELIKMSGNGLNNKGQRDLSKTDGLYNYVDCMYIQILQDFGWIFTVLILVLMTIAMYQTYKKRDWYLLMICSILAVHGIIDDLIINVYYNTFWLIIAPYVFRPFIYRIKYRNENLLFYTETKID
ncbi:hypothetical protein [Pseudoramibacter porci]|uniref:O-antigen ligase domain-containing protein n=1 Tax=Pseudoramibacter porci TaxID=2606631 RepID=A0A7X2TA91_9FIRM|nr:hypothetical protein [Pseudoramibacter porci]MSS19583.1 hypothetical protein [Pseudoramibacter porci]